MFQVLGFGFGFCLSLCFGHGDGMAALSQITLCSVQSLLVLQVVQTHKENRNEHQSVHTEHEADQCNQDVHGEEGNHEPADLGDSPCGLDSSAQTAADQVGQDVQEETADPGFALIYQTSEGQVSSNNGQQEADQNPQLIDLCKGNLSLSPLHILKLDGFQQGSFLLFFVLLCHDIRSSKIFLFPKEYLYCSRNWQGLSILLLLPVPENQAFSSLLKYFRISFSSSGASRKTAIRLLPAVLSTVSRP